MTTIKEGYGIQPYHKGWTGSAGLVVPGSMGTKFITNNHVIPDVGLTFVKESEKEILGKAIATKKPYYAGLLSRFIRWILGLPLPVSKIDATIMQMYEGNTIERQKPSDNVDSPVVGMVVHKWGRTTGYTTGKVTNASMIVRVRGQRGVAVFEDVFEISNETKGGDSGGADRNDEAGLGVTFAGNGVSGYCIKAENILAELPMPFFQF